MLVKFFFSEFVLELHLFCCFMHKPEGFVVENFLHEDAGGGRGLEGRCGISVLKFSDSKADMQCNVVPYKVRALFYYFWAKSGFQSCSSANWT